MNDDVHSVAEAYLKDIGATNIPHVIHGTRFKASAYVETPRQFTKRIEMEKEKRYEVDVVPEKFVVKSGHRYFYGFKGEEAKWTYDSKLAFVFNEVGVGMALDELESLKFEVTKYPAPVTTDRS